MGYGFNGGFGGGNIQNLMRQAQKMQAEMEEAKNKLDVTEFKSSVGGGMVEVTMLGCRKITNLVIKENVVDPEDVEMLQDLIVSAVNDVLDQINKAEKATIPSVPGM